MDSDNKNISLDDLEETHKKLEEITAPIIKQQQEIERIANIANYTPVINMPTNLWQQYPGLQNAITAMGKIAELTPKINTSMIKAFEFYDSFKFNFPIIADLNTWNQVLNDNILTSIKRIYDSIKPITTAISPALQWLSNLNLTPLYDWLSTVNLESDYSERYEELEAEYRNAMFACKWFPYAGWTVDGQILNDVSYILATSRNKAENKRREKRIDEVVFKYYTKKVIKEIKSRWYHSDLKPHVKKILGQAIEAHFRGEYVLTTTCLATMWEGLIRDKLNVKRINQTKTAAELKELSGANNFEDIYADFYNKLILGPCNSPDEVIEGIPNRNAISHSQYKKYPNKKSSLNAILITDFLIHLKPKEIPEENKDGQTQNAQPQ